MNEVSINNHERKLSLWQKIRKKFLHLLRLTDDKVLKVYHGYGSRNEMILFGHVFSLSPLPRKRYRKNFWTNTLALLRSFMVVPVRGATVTLEAGGKLIETTTATDGFFRLDWHTEKVLPPGLHTVQVQLRKDGSGSPVIATAPGHIIVPHTNQYAFVSDIDDTFLVSHSATFFRKLYVLFTKNAHSRKPFEGVVKHYRLLANAHAGNGQPNPFFYVSSSEWNLYDFIKEFIRKNDLPEGVFLLSQVKKFYQVFKTGANKHATKFMRIARILEAYPVQKFILLGDDSQMDPVIYAKIVEHFPDRIHSVYLRHVYEKNLTNVRELIEKIEAAGVPVCHFEHSSEAITHSVSFGLITNLELSAYLVEN
ncbi:App1 family protein [Aridibaculum aurantiacum]|uniref:App1 family protein n=1 Tax=Aridibaculum aurantiacum TaxID=2810307 RepID=UPI001A960D0A|nr:phosphatase domain-containing protein [Aridibaculum aurantiacum]